MVEPQLTPEDLAEIKETRREFMLNRAVPLDVTTPFVTGIDEFTGLAISTPVTVTISGAVHTIQDKDRLLALGGRIKAGDLKVTFYWDDISGIITTIREATIAISSPWSGTPAREYIVDVLEEKGIGQPNRVELGLVLK